GDATAGTTRSATGAAVDDTAEADIAAGTVGGGGGIGAAMLPIGCAEGGAAGSTGGENLAVVTSGAGVDAGAGAVETALAGGSVRGAGCSTRAAGCGAGSDRRSVADVGSGAAMSAI